jgi:preprotein translocase subunit Sss1
VQAAIETGNLSDEWVLVALPAFGVVGVVGFVVFVSAVVSD